MKGIRCMTDNKGNNKNNNKNNNNNRMINSINLLQLPLLVLLLSLLFDHGVAFCVSCPKYNYNSQSSFLPHLHRQVPALLPQQRQQQSFVQVPSTTSCGVIQLSAVYRKQSDGKEENNVIGKKRQDGSKLYLYKQRQQQPNESSSSSSDRDGLSSLDGSSGTTATSSSLLRLQETLSPAVETLDDVTGGYLLSVADLSPESEQTPVGQIFLATNIGYAALGFFLTVRGELFLGLITEFVSVASFAYHYTQLQFPDRAEDRTVRVALTIDYVLACSSIFVAAVYLFMDHQLPPIDGMVSGGLGVACLLGCFIWDAGLPYIVLHSIWHILSAYSGYTVGISHLGV